MLYQHPKRYSLLLLVFLYCQLSYAIDWYRPGDTLQVWAQSGLNMRNKAGLDAQVVARIPYGAAVIVQSEKLFYNQNGLRLPVLGREETPSSFVLEGQWVEVQYGSHRGFVADMYLGRLPALRATEREELPKYLARIHPTLSLQAVQISPEEGLIDSTFTSGAGLIYALSTSDYHRKEALIGPHLSKEEAYLLASAWLQLEEHLKKDRPYFYPTVEAEDDNMLMLRLNEITYLTIRREEAVTTIVYSVSD